MHTVDKQNVRKCQQKILALCLSQFVFSFCFYFSQESDNSSLRMDRANKKDTFAKPIQMSFALTKFCDHSANG